MAQPLLVKIVCDDKGNIVIEKLNRNIKATKTTAASTGDIMKAVFGSAIVLKGISMLTANLGQAVKNATDFELAITKIKAITGVTGQNLTNLSDEARNLAKSTEFSAAAISSAMLEVTKMGFSPTETLRAMPDMLNLSTAASEDLQYSAKNTVNIMKAFGMETDQTTRVVNVMTTALNATSLNLEDYMEAMKYVAPVAKELNMSFEEASAILGVLRDAAIGGSLGGTSLRNMLLNLIKPTGDSAKAIKNLDFQGKTLTQSLEMMRGAGVGVSDFLGIFGKRAIVSAELVASGAGKVYTLYDELMKQSRTAEEVAEEMRQSQQLLWTSMINNLNLVGISINEALGAGSKNLMETIISEIQELDQWVKNNHESIKEMADSFAEFFKIITLVGLPALKAVVDNLKWIGQALVFAGLTKGILGVTTTLTALNAAGGGTAVMLGTVSAASVPFAAAMAAVAMALAGPLLWIAKLNTELERQNANLAAGETKGKLKLLRDLQQAMREVSVQKQTNAATIDIDGSDAVKLAGLKQRVSDLTEEWVKLYGPSSRSRIDTMQEVNNELNYTSSALFKEEVAALKAAEATKTLAGAFGDMVDTGKTGAGAASTWLEEWEKAIERLATIEEMDNKRKEARVKENEQWLSDWEKSIARLQAIEDMDKARLDEKKKNEDANRELVKSSAESTVDFIDTVITMQDQKEQAIYERRMARINSEHDWAIAQAGDSAFKKQMAEEKYLQAKEKLDAEQMAREKERSKQMKALAIIRANISTYEAVASVFASEYGGVAFKAIAGGAMMALGTAQVAAIAAQPLRAGGIIGGEGNSSSDSNFFRGSRGERVLSTDQISRMGGNSSIDQMIDRGNHYNSNSSVVIKIDNFIGNKEFVRTILPVMQKELRR